MRTIRSVFYLAGERPIDSDPEMFRAWPPPPPERRAIDADYAVAEQQAKADEAAWRAYEEQRRAWLRTDEPRVATEPVHNCVVVVPHADDDDVAFEEFDDEGRVCGAKSRSGRIAFGSPAEVLGSVTGLDPSDAWIQAVVAALDRERAWQGFERRSALEVGRGAGEMYHVSPSGNRESIERYGLDWRRMGGHAGVAGAESPELDAVFLCGSQEEARFFTEMARVPTDVWAVDVTDCWLENGPSGWLILSEAVPAESLRLLSRDVTSRRRR